MGETTMIKGKILQAMKALTFAKEMHAEAQSEVDKRGRFFSGDLRQRFPGGHRKYEEAMQRLVRNGYLESLRGPNGGFWISDKGLRAKGWEIVVIFASKEEKPSIGLFKERLEALSPKQCVAHVEDWHAAQQSRLDKEAA